MDSARLGSSAAASPEGRSTGEFERCAVNRRILRAIASTAVIAAGLFSTDAATARGFFECRDGVWVGVGAPRHAKPSRACGDKPVLPRSESDCRAGGGRWGPVGLFPTPICVVATRDGGRVCGDVLECEGTCLLDTKGDRAAQFRPKHEGPATGVCSRARPVFGCLTEVTRGRIGRRLCLD